MVWRECVQRNIKWDVPSGAVGKNPPANAGDMGLIPGLKEIDHEQGQGVVIEKWATPCINN